MLGVVTAVEAATFATASTLHRGMHVPLLGITGERFPGAVIPEAIIAVVLFVGAAVVLAAPQRSWRTAIGTHLFAFAGTIVGVSEVLAGTQARPYDLVYHVAILALLGGMLVVLFRSRGRAALGRGRAAPRGLSRPGPSP
jgi:hypothetical protein